MHRKKKVIPTTNFRLVSSGQMSSAGREIQDKSKEMTTIISKSTGEIGLQQPNDPQDVEFSYNSDSSADVALAAKVVPSITFSTETLFVLDIKYQFITHKLTQLVSSMMSSEIGLQQLRDFQNDEDFNNSHSSANNAQAANIAPSVSFPQTHYLQKIML